jgi:2'-hydroxyisoflavone reductase
LGETKTYGVIKALSEVENNKTFGDRAINVRPNFIVGPGDPTPRFLYWPARHAVGGEIMVPGRPDDHVQFADVRDLTAFMIHLVEQGASGTFNTAGEDDITMQRFQQGLALAVPSQHSLTWIADHEFLRSHRIGGMVPWIPPKRTAQGSAYGQTYINSDKAVSVGLRYRPMTETIRDTFAWWRSLAQEKRETYQFPMTPAREQILLSAWHEQGKALG